MEFAQKPSEMMFLGLPGVQTQKQRVFGTLRVHTVPNRENVEKNSKA